MTSSKRSSLSRTWRYKLIGATPFRRQRADGHLVRTSFGTARAATSTTCSLEMLPQAARVFGRDLLRAGCLCAAMDEPYPKMCTHTHNGYTYQ